MARFQKTRYPHIYKRGQVYYYRFRSETGRWVQRRYGTDLGNARAAQLQAQNEADAIGHRITTRERIESQRHATAPIGEHLRAYEDHMKASGCTRGHFRACLSRCRFAVAAMALTCLADLSAAKVEQMLDSVTVAGRNARTRNDYLVKLNGFVNWCVRNGRMESNPLSAIRTRGEAQDRRRPVRALTPDEFGDLLLATPDPKRRLAYWLAGGMGLRWTEIRKVLWSDVDMARGWISLPASTAKSRKVQAVPMSPLVWDVLKGIPFQSGPVCPHPPIRRTWMADIKRAGIAHKTEHGQADRRCLRKTFITHLALGGVDLRMAQRLARHARPELTANVYTDAALLPVADAMRKLGEVQDRKGRAG